MQQVSGHAGLAELAEPSTDTSRDEMGLASAVSTLTRRRETMPHCGWCGRPVAQGGRLGRRRRYCGQSCRQRAYERRSAVHRGGLPEDAVVLSHAEIATLQDRIFQLRCAAEDIATAADDGADRSELRGLAAEVAQAARDLEQLR